MTAADLHGARVVITGASSGIGRATALMLAGHGARVVLGARRQDALNEVAAACRDRGGEAVAIAGDVADPAYAGQLAATAVAEFGGADAWVNNAGVYAVGLFEELPADVFERVVAVNLHGVVLGSRAALEQFRRQGHGVLINVSSMVGGLAGAWVSPYAATKWAVRGFTLALHEELRDDRDIHACVVRPAAIDTPIFRHAANFSGRSMRALTPTYPPEQVASAIAGLMADPRREVLVGRSGKALAALHAVFPGPVDRMFAKHSERNHFVPGAAAAPTDGNIFTPDPGWRSTTGAWRRQRRNLRPALVLPAAGAGLLAALTLRR